PVPHSARPANHADRARYLANRLHAGSLSTGDYVRQGFGAHFEASGSRRKCELVTRRPRRYSGSTTCVVTTNHSVPSGTGKRSKNSVTVVSALEATPLRRSQPPLRLVVTTRSEPPGGGGGPPGKLIPNGLLGGSVRCQSAAESPCKEGAPDGRPAPKCNRRVCWPLSVSIFSVASSAQEIRTRVGMRIRAAAPNALHEPSVFGSHAIAIARPAGLSGSPGKSPRGAVIIRQRQSSLTIDTQTPVRSMGADARGVAGGPRPLGGDCRAA